MFQKKFVEKIKTRIFGSIFFLENRKVYNMEKYCRAGQSADDNIAQEYNMQCSSGYRKKSQNMK
jgi:hypothetical protein